MIQILKIIATFLNANIGVVTFGAGFIAIYLYLRQKGDNKRDAARLILQEIRFYPFVAKKNLRKYQLSAKARRANYWMFCYTGLDKLPYFEMYKK